MDNFTIFLRRDFAEIWYQHNSVSESPEIRYIERFAKVK